MSSGDLEDSSLLAEAVDLACSGTFGDALEMLGRLQAPESPSMARLRSSLIELVGRCSQALGAKEEAIGALQMSALDIDEARHKLSQEVLRRRATERELEAKSMELQASNAKLNAAATFLNEIYRTMPGMLLVFNTEGTIEAVNDAACAMLDYGERDLLGQSVTRIFGGDQCPTFDEIKSRTSTGTVLREERVCRTRSGTEIPVLFSATVFADHRPRGVVSLAFDIRERKKLESELRQAQKLESVGRLAAGVAHEINTPVQFVSDSICFVQEAVRSFAALIQDYRIVNRSVLDGSPAVEKAGEIAVRESADDLEFLLSEVPQALETSRDGLGRIATIVRSMKDFAHPDENSKTAININEAVLNTLTIAGSEYKYVADVQTDLGDVPLVTGFAGEINQAILNLLVNAAHAVAAVVDGTTNRGLITIKTCREGGTVVLAISDTGGGIPEGIRERVFDPFFTTKEVGKGTGQGLSIARSVIQEKHGGTLTFQSETGRGTTFTIRLPIEETGTAAAALDSAA